MNKKDQHVEVICKKFDLYKSEMEKEFPGDDYPYSNLTPWTNYYVEGSINSEDLEFEKWFDEKWSLEKMIDESIEADMNTKRYYGSTLLEWSIGGIIFLIFIAIMLLSTHASAGVCDSWGYANGLDGSIGPTSSGTYYVVDKNRTYSDGTYMSVGKGFEYTGWKDSFWGKAHDISCKITDIESTGGYTFGEYKSCYLITLHCDVSERMQFYADGIVTYYDLQGYRNNGTLKWSRDKVGSTDIYCYDKNGIGITKRVNNPAFCK